MITLHIDSDQLYYLQRAIERDREDMFHLDDLPEVQMADGVLELLSRAEQEQAIPF